MKAVKHKYNETSIIIKDAEDATTSIQNMPVGLGSGEFFINEAFVNSVRFV